MVTTAIALSDEVSQVIHQPEVILMVDLEAQAISHNLPVNHKRSVTIVAVDACHKLRRKDKFLYLQILRAGA